MSKACHKIPISQSQGYVHSKLEKLATNAAKSRKEVFKKFQIKENTYSCVKGDIKEHALQKIQSLKDEKTLRIFITQFLKRK